MRRKGAPLVGRAVNIRDVAEYAGVSPMTVSRTLREPEKVSQEARRRVEGAIRETGYFPNQIASSLSSKRSNVVGLIVPNIANSLFVDTVQAVSDVLRTIDYHLLVADSGYSLVEEEGLIAAFLGQRVSGIVLHNTEHTPRARHMLQRAGVPVVETGNLGRQPLDMAVSYSNFEASRAMAQHLARRGYRHIGFVSLPSQDNDRVQERRRGYFAALQELGVPADPGYAIEVPHGIASGAEALNRLLAAHPELDAIFFAGDVLAVGALLECQRRGLAVPGRIAIASSDDVEILAHLNPPLTTLRIPRYAIGKRAAEVLIDRIQGRAKDKLVLDLGFEIVQRAST